MDASGYLDSIKDTAVAIDVSLLDLFTDGVTCLIVDPVGSLPIDSDGSFQLVNSGSIPDILQSDITAMLYTDKCGQECFKLQSGKYRADVSEVSTCRVKDVVRLLRYVATDADADLLKGATFKYVKGPNDVTYRYCYFQDCTVIEPIVAKGIPMFADLFRLMSVMYTRYMSISQEVNYEGLWSSLPRDYKEAGVENDIVYKSWSKFVKSKFPGIKVMSKGFLGLLDSDFTEALRDAGSLTDV